MSLIDLFEPPKPPEPKSISRVHNLMEHHIPPVNKLKLTFEQAETRAVKEKARKQRWTLKRTELRRIARG